MSELQEPPHNEDAEESLLGAIMVDGATIDRVRSRLGAEDFYREGHREMYRAMCEMHDESEGVPNFDPVTLGDRLERRDALEAVGGPGELMRLSRETPSAANADQYLDLVLEYSRLRDVRQKTASIAREAQGEPENVGDFLERVERDILAATRTAHERDYEHVEEVVKGAYEDLEALYESDSEITGLSSGYPDLDDITEGFGDEELVIVAARPGMGKTTLALNLADHMAIDHGVSAGMFSLEMSNQQLAMRLLCARAKVNKRRLKRGLMNEEGWGRLVQAAGSIQDADLLLDDTPALSVAEFRSKCRRMKAEYDIGAIFIDYLQLMTGTGGHDLREQEIAEITRNLKAVAKELEIPVIALAQLNRGVENRQDKRPRLKDLRESGQIEQDADIICFIYRDEVYNEDTDDQGVAEVIVRKNREGPTGTARLRFVPEHTRFDSLAEGYNQ